MAKQRFVTAYDDMHGEVRSSLSGSSVWTEAAIGDTGFICGQMVNGSGVPSNDDYFQFKAEAPHSRKLGANLGDIHIHFINESASTSGETVLWDVYYCWLKFGDVMPTAASWTTLTGSTITQVLETKAAKTYQFFAFTTNITSIASETYGSTLFFKVWRRQGTHTGRIAIVDASAHTPNDRLGSETAAAD